MTNNTIRQTLFKCIKDINGELIVNGNKMANDFFDRFVERGKNEQVKYKSFQTENLKIDQSPVLLCFFI